MNVTMACIRSRAMQLLMYMPSSHFLPSHILQLNKKKKKVLEDVDINNWMNLGPWVTMWSKALCWSISNYETNLYYAKLFKYWSCLLQPLVYWLIHMDYEIKLLFTRMLYSPKYSLKNTFSVFSVEQRRKLVILEMVKPKYLSSLLLVSIPTSLHLYKSGKRE